MNHESLNEVLKKNKINGFIVATDNKGGLIFTRNCDVVTLMGLNTFANYNVNGSIDVAVNQSRNEGKLAPKEVKKLDLNIKPFKKP